MIVLLLILVMLTIVSAYVLFAPIYLEVNTALNILRLRFHKVASAELLMAQQTLLLEIKVAKWKKQIDLFAPKAKKKKITVKKLKTSKGFPLSLSKLKSIISSFKINTCYINLDFENGRWNTMLYPLFFGLSMRFKKQFQINFMGLNQINIQIENNLARILRAYLFNKQPNKLNH